MFSKGEQKSWSKDRDSLCIFASHVQYPTKITVGYEYYKVVSSKKSVKVDSTAIDFIKILAV